MELSTGRPHAVSPAQHQLQGPDVDAWGMSTGDSKAAGCGLLQGTGMGSTHVGMVGYG